MTIQMLIKREISVVQNKRLYIMRNFQLVRCLLGLNHALQRIAVCLYPGVGYICEQIKQDPQLVKKLTMVGNNVCVISNGTAVLGLGDLGALLLKPVMEGKSFVDARIKLELAPLNYA